VWSSKLVITGKKCKN